MRNCYYSLCYSTVKEVFDMSNSYRDQPFDISWQTMTDYAMF